MAGLALEHAGAKQRGDQTVTRLMHRDALAHVLGKRASAPLTSPTRTILIASLKCFAVMSLSPALGAINPT